MGERGVMAVSKFSIDQQIDEVEREIALRKNVYPRMVRSGQMRQSIADYHRERMEAVKATLEFLRDNADWLRACFIEREKKKGQAA